jgi:Rod binding domain-containing protein
VTIDHIGAAEAAHTPQTRTTGAAKDFEALLIAQMLRSAREAGGSEGWLDSGGGAASSAVEFAEQQLASTMAASGGLGLAKLVSKSLEAAADQRP